MINLTADLNILIYNSPIDMRKSIDGLSYIVAEAMQQDPQDKAMYLFHNKNRDKFKAIIWDGNGFLLLYKRLEEGRFKFPQNIKSQYYDIDADLFNWLCKGFDFYALKQHPELKKSKYF